MNYEKKGLNEALDNIIGESASAKDLRKQIKDIAPLDLTVLISGETGCGKELVAKALHQTSKRRHAAIAAVNCASISPQLFESEFFGHEKGSFTGAQGQSKGIFEQAQHGTLFLDEVGELPLDFQAKLLRVLESRTIRRVGGKEEIPIDVRIIAATHRNLNELVELKKFREDLYYRLHVVSLHVTSLRERLMDVPLLAKYFLESMSEGKVKYFTKKAEYKLLSYSWPGNVRELKNVISSSLVYNKKSFIEEQDILLPVEVSKSDIDALIAKVYRNGGSVREAAKILGMSKSTLQRKLKNIENSTKKI